MKETFKKQYKLTTWVEVQTRYRTVVMIDIFTGIPYTVQVPYEYRIFHTKLVNKGLEVVIREELNNDQWKRYEIFQDTLGGRPYLFNGGLPPGGSDGSGSPGIDYQIPAEALTDSEFAAIYKEAQKYVGTPYVWGGSTPETGFDCSGYVCWVYNQNGYDVGRTTANGLWNKSQHISEAEAKPGDLVFFDETYDTLGKSHVGIYLGNGKMVSAGDPIKYADIHSSYGRFDFDPTELKNARARNAAANAAAAEFERQEQEKADKEASNAGKTFAVVAQEYIASNRSRMALSVRLKGDYDANRNKENTSLKKEKYLQRIQSYPEFSEKAIGTITRQDCDAVIRFLEDSDARVYKRAVLKPESKEFKTVSCPKIAKNCTIREETIKRIFRGETVSLDSAQQVAMALGKTVEQMFEVEIDRRPMTKKTMREYNLFIQSVLNYANDNYGTSLQMPMIKASGRKGKSVDCLHSDEVEALQAALKECSMLEKAIVLCLLNTGVRRGELAGLTWKDVDFREGTIHVSKSLLVFQNYGYQLTTTKESNIRDVDVAPEFMAFLKGYHEQWKSRKKLMGASWQKNLEKKGSKYAQSLLDLRGNDFVICNDYGFPINPDSYAALVRRVGKKAGIEKIHPHMFRHAFVSILLSNPNIGVSTVAAEAGHAQPSTTLAIYTQVYDRRRDEIRKQMSKELYK